LDKGIITISLGENYSRFLIDCLKISRLNTQLPILVVTNHENKEWNNIFNLRLKKVDCDFRDNRDLKVSMCDFSPFDKTLFIDSDSVINNSIDEIFETLENNDLYLCRCLKDWKNGDKIPKIYHNVMSSSKAKLPITVWRSALIGFSKSENSKNFFNTWKCIYEKTKNECYRDMPSMACAFQKEKNKLKYKEMPEHYFDSKKINSKCLVQHYCRGFSNHYKIKDLKHYKTFDNSDDWELLYYE
jgi:alpha-N-acetylglucosamine transferase